MVTYWKTPGHGDFSRACLQENALGVCRILLAEGHAPHLRAFESSQPAPLLAGAGLRGKAIEGTKVASQANRIELSGTNQHKSLSNKIAWRTPPFINSATKRISELHGLAQCCIVFLVVSLSSSVQRAKRAAIHTNL